MMIEREDRAVFSEQLRERRRRGRPRVANQMVPLSICLPADVLAAYCQRAREQREEHVTAVVRRVLIEAIVDARS